MRNIKHIHKILVLYPIKMIIELLISAIYLFWTGCVKLWTVNNRSIWTTKIDWRNVIELSIYFSLILCVRRLGTCFMSNYIKCSIMQLLLKHIFWIIHYSRTLQVLWQPFYDLVYEYDITFLRIPNYLKCQLFYTNLRNFVFQDHYEYWRYNLRTLAKSCSTMISCR